MKSRHVIAIALSVLLLTGGLAWAGPGGFGGFCDGPRHGEMNAEEHAERMEHRVERMSTILDLNESQQAQIETLLNQQWQDKQALRTQLQASRDELHTAMAAHPFDEAEVRSKAAKQAELKTEMLVEHAKLRQQIYAILTPEQQQKADELLELRGSGKGHHPRGGRHGMGF